MTFNYKMFVVFLTVYSLLFVFVEGVQKLFFKKNNWTRKAIHIGVGFVLFPMPYYLSDVEIIVIAIIFTVSIIISKYFSVLALHNVNRKTIGEILYPVSIGILAIICLPVHIKAFQAGCLVLAFSDGLAAVIGSRFSIRKFEVFGNKKSLGGSLTFAISTLVIFTTIGFETNDFLLIVLLISLLTLLEFFLVYGLDNFFIPLIAAIFFIYLI